MGEQVITTSKRKSLFIPGCTVGLWWMNWLELQSNELSQLIFICIRFRWRVWYDLKMHFWVVYHKSCLKVSYRATRGFVLIHSILFLSLKVLRHSPAAPCRFAFTRAAWLNVIQHISEPWLHLLFKEKLSEVSSAPDDLAVEVSRHWRARLTLPWFSQSPITDNSSTLRLIFHTQMIVMNQASLWTHLSDLSWLKHVFWRG